MQHFEVHTLHTQIFKMAPESMLQQWESIVLMGQTMSQRATCAATGLPLPTVNRVLQAFYMEGCIADASHGQPERATTEDYWLIFATAVEEPFLSAWIIRDVVEFEVSAQTIQSGLHATDIKYRAADASGKNTPGPANGVRFSRQRLNRREMELCRLQRKREFCPCLENAANLK